MNHEDVIFSQWVKDAKEEVADKGWQESSNNAVTIVCFDMLGNHVASKIIRVIWKVCGVLSILLLSLIGVIAAVLG